jgi:hypothetical protein
MRTWRDRDGQEYRFTDLPIGAGGVVEVERWSGEESGYWAWIGSVTGAEAPEDEGEARNLVEIIQREGPNA